MSKEEPPGNQDTNLDGHTGCCFCKMPLFHQSNSNKLLKSSGIYKQLVMSSGLSSYFRSSLCSHIKTLGRLSFAAMGEVKASASYMYAGKHLGSTPSPCRQGERRVVSLFSNEKHKLKSNIFPSMHRGGGGKNPFFTSLDGYWENSGFAHNSPSLKLFFPLSKSCCFKKVDPI